MKTLILILLLYTFSFPSAKTQKLMCPHCNARDADNCNGTLSECPEGSSCMTIAQKDKFNTSIQSIEKRCSLNMPCNITGYGYATSNILFDTVMACCEQDRCNEGPLRVPEPPTIFKGGECGSCYSPDTDVHCTANERTTCREETDKCGSFFGSVIKADGVFHKFAVQGCISSYYCSSDLKQMVGMFFQNITEFKCYNPKAIAKPYVQ